MKASVIVPVGDADAWAECEKGIRESVAAARTPGFEAEIVPSFDLGRRGAFAARNEGLSRASGDWILWVDCDDAVERGWFGEIAAAVLAHPDADVVQFDATEVRGGATRPLKYGAVGEVSGDAFARELLRNDGMPAWLWTRAFRRTLFDGLSFKGRVKHDYGMFLKLLPRIRRVWSVGKPLYRYIKHGHGLSDYVQPMDYREAGRRFADSIAALPREWRHDADVGLCLTMADAALHAKGARGAAHWTRRRLAAALFDRRVPARLKLKALAASVKF